MHALNGSGSKIQYEQHRDQLMREAENYRLAQAARQGQGAPYRPRRINLEAFMPVTWKRRTPPRQLSKEARL